MDVVGYTRVSTRSQGDSGNGLQAQRNAVTAFCKAQGFNLVGFRNDVCSGTVNPMDRGGFAAASAMQLPIVVAKRDRIARDAVACMMVDRIVDLLCVGGNNEDTPEAAAMRGMLDVFAEYERKVIAARTRAALAAKRSRGEYAGGRPAIGLRAVDGELQADTHGQRILRRVAALVEAGDNPASITRALAEEGFVNSTGKPFARTQIVRFIKRVAA